MSRFIGLLCLTLLAIGCASPGPPRSPSLQIPSVVDTLIATRRANTIELQFTLPTTTTDSLLYRAPSMRADICRALDAGPCLPLVSLTDVLFSTPRGYGGTADSRARLTNTLPTALTIGPPRLLTYRVELLNESGASAGYGEAAYSAAGLAPSGVKDLRVHGARQGVVVRWSEADTPDAGAVVLRRELIAGGVAGDSGAPVTSVDGARAHTQPAVQWLSTVASPDPLTGQMPAPVPGGLANGAVDDSARVGSTYRYAAERQRTVQLGGHSVLLHSTLSAPVEITLQAVYPPAPPTDLAGTAFPGAVDVSGASGPASVDLIWTPPDESSLVGYNVYREPVGADNQVRGARIRLTSAPTKSPTWHDVPPVGVNAFRYSVTAVDERGLESAPTSAVVQMR